VRRHLRQQRTWSATHIAALQPSWRSTRPGAGAANSIPLRGGGGACMLAVGALTLAVTLGLPSRSPPIHEPNLMGVAFSGSSRPAGWRGGWWAGALWGVEGRGSPLLLAMGAGWMRGGGGCGIVCGWWWWWCVGEGGGPDIQCAHSSSSSTQQQQQQQQLQGARRACSSPVAFLSAALTRRRKVGTAVHSDCSTMCSPPRASARGSSGSSSGRRQAQPGTARPLAAGDGRQPVSSPLVPQLLGQLGGCDPALARGWQDSRTSTACKAPAAAAAARRAATGGRAPSTGVGFSLRSSSVCHSDVISRTRSSTTWLRSSLIRSDLGGGRGGEGGGSKRQKRWPGCGQPGGRRGVVPGKADQPRM
jgi:hypothetical protein